MSGNTLVMMQANTADTQSGTDVVDSLDRFLQTVESHAFKMSVYATRDRSEALDIVQDAMTAFVRRYRGKPGEQWRPLFFRTLDNKIKDWYRRRHVRFKWFSSSRPAGPGDDLDVVDMAVDTAAVDPTRLVDSDSAGQALERALCALPDRQRQAFLLRTWQGMSVAETAQVMGCSEGSVKTHLSRALGSLRDKLEMFR